MVDAGGILVELVRSEEVVLLVDLGLLDPLLVFYVGTLLNATGRKENYRHKCRYQYYHQQQVGALHAFLPETVIQARSFYLSF